MFNSNSYNRSGYHVELWCVDWILAAFLVAVSALEIIFRAHVDGWESLVLKNVAVLTSYPAFLMLARHSMPSLRMRSLVRILCVTLSTSFIYNEMGKIIHIVFPYWWDASINAVERSVFGVYPSVWLQSFASPWLTELMMFAYVIYVPLIPAVALLSLSRDDDRRMERYLTELTLAYLLCYAFYFLVPVAGPSRALRSLHTVPLTGYFFTAIADSMIANVHLPGGAFPSAHCAAAVVMTAAFYRIRRPAGHAFFALALLIFVSTVYGRFHYVTDVAAGILIGCFALYVTQAILSSFSRGLIHIAAVVPAREPGALHQGLTPDGAPWTDPHVRKEVGS